MIKILASTIFEKIFNRLLQLDPQTFSHIKSFAGKVVLLNITDWHQHFYVLFSNQGVKILNTYAAQPDTIITASSLTLLRQKFQTAPTSDLTIEGDLELGEELRNVLQAMDIDWEEQLAKYSGDVIAHQVGNVARKVLNWGKEQTQNVSEDLTDYLQEEAHILPTQHEINEFIEEVNDVRHAVDRLEKRFEELINAGEV